MNNIKFLKKILVLVGIIFLLFSTFIIVLFLDIKHKSENIFSLEDELSNKSEKNTYLMSIQKVVENSDAFINQIDSSIMPSDGDVSIIERIESLAKMNGLDITIDSLSLDDIKNVKDKNIVSLKIKARTTGAWAGTYAFISEIESLPYVVRVDNLALMMSTDSGQVVSKKQWQSVFEIHLLKYK